MSNGISTRRSSAPTWWIVFTREVTDLWMGGKGLTLILAYTLILGLWSYMLAVNTELSLIPPKEMVWEMLEATISVGCFICLVAGADTISGDRERQTLEGLLLTPTSRRQLVMGKLLAVMSLWPGVLLITIPYLAVLAQGGDYLGTAVFWGTIVGSIMAAAMTALGALVSVRSNTLKASMFTSLGIFLLIMLPHSLPGKAHSGIGLELQKVEPLMAAYHFLGKILVNNRSVAEMWGYLIAPVLFAVLMLGMLFLASSGLRLEASPGRARSWLARAFGAFAITGFLLSALSVPSMAGNLVTEPPQAPVVIEQATTNGEAVAGAGQALDISIDKQFAVVGQGDSIVYRTFVTNQGKEVTGPLTLAMNIINLDAKGEIVDPEDWSPRRTQYLDTLEPGQKATLTWKVNAIMDGDYMLYMVVIPKPDRPEATSLAVASSGIHMTVSPRTKLNPRGILVYVIGTPLILAAGMIYLNRRRRKMTDEATA